MNKNHYHRKTINNAELIRSQKVVIKKLHQYKNYTSVNYAVKNSHFLSGLRLRLMGGGVTSLRRLGL